MAKNNKTAALKDAAVTSVKWILSPTGRFNLSYEPGDVCDLNAEQAQEAIELGYAELSGKKAKVSTDKVETTTVEVTLAEETAPEGSTEEAV